ncbi:hypothetical protein C8F01DRAFT_1137157 [Mycena amicta]|nr:hypothetical protein C8F01DRAFT_1137157 [Mycena amicta]
MLWARVSVGNNVAPEILELWLEHAKPCLLDLHLYLNDPDLSLALLAVCIKYAERWQDIYFGIPLTTYPQLAAALVREDLVLPVLRNAVFRIHHSVSDQVVEDIVAIRDAPALHTLVIGTHPHLEISAPWPQLASLELSHNMLLGVCLQILVQCAALEELSVNTSDEPDPSPIVAASADEPLVLPRLKILTCNLYSTQSLLPRVTLPALTQLTTRESNPEIADSVLSSFFKRSGPPPLLKIHLYMTSFPGVALLRTLEAFPDSVNDAEFTVRSEEETLQSLFDTLLLERSRDRVLPGLATLRLQTEYLTITHADYDAMLHLLQARSQISQLVVLQRTNYAGGVAPSNEVIEGLRALGVSRGLRVKLTVMARARPRPWAESRVLEI